MKQLAAGSHPFCKTLAAAKNPVVIVGSEALQREDGGAVISLVQQIADNAKVGKINAFSNHVNIDYRDGAIKCWLNSQSQHSICL